MKFTDEFRLLLLYRHSFTGRPIPVANQWTWLFSRYNGEGNIAHTQELFEVFNEAEPTVKALLLVTKPPAL
jgi:hypothetical protein